MEKRILLFILSLHLSQAFLCSQIDIGTDTSKIGDIVSSGVVQPGWRYNDAAYRSPPAESLLYFYIRGLEFIGPDFKEVAFKFDDLALPPQNRWLWMNVSIDDELDSFFREYKVYKVEQQCSNKEGGVTQHVNVTFAAIGCDPITVNWMKVCGEPTEIRNGLSVGFSESSSELVYNGAPTMLFDSNLKQDAMTISNDDDYTIIYLWMNDAYSSTFFKSPYVLTDHEVMYPTLEGSAISGGWLDRTPKSIQINYNCLEKKGKKEELALVIELPYFHNIELHFYKECGAKPKAKSGLTWMEIFYLVFGAGLLGISMYVFYEYRKGKRGIEMFPFSNHLEDIYDSIFNRPSSGPRGDFSKELPDLDDDGRTGLNVKTTYGTI